MDRVGAAAEAWERAHPDWDVTGLEVLGRIARIERLLDVRRLEALREEGLTTADVDVLAGLWFHPAGQRPRDLRRTLLVGSGTLTPRLDRLEAAGWLRRRPDPDDLRGRVLVLTESGRRRVPRLVERLLRIQNDALSGLPRGLVDRLAGDLARLLADLEENG
jgi:DNA-binding MarR family transcriptional regulator